MIEAWLGRMGAATSVVSAALFPRRESLNASHFTPFARWRRVTSSPNGHILTNAQVWSADGEWIYFDVRSDRHGAAFDGQEIRRVHAKSGVEEVVYRTGDQSCCGVVLAHPHQDKIVFIQGPEYPNAAWSYGASRRCGALLPFGSLSQERLDARDMVEPFTAGAHRGGSHVHQFSPQGDWISFTYEDEYLDSLARRGKVAEKNQRNIGIAVPGHNVSVKPRHPRNQSAGYYSLICTQTWDQPKPGSDEIQRAYEESWIGTDGYCQSDGTQQRRSLVFLGDLLLENGIKSTELFIIDLPENVVDCDRFYRAQTELRGRRLKPCPEIKQRRLTNLTAGCEPGLQGIRFWPRTTPDGAYVFVFKKDRQGIVQFWCTRTCDGETVQWTKNSLDIGSAFTVSADGKWLAHTMGGAVCVTSCKDGRTLALTHPFEAEAAPLPEAVVWNQAGTSIAFVCPQRTHEKEYNQIFVLDVDREKLDRH
jgi:hypothetical protein